VLQKLQPDLVHATSLSLLMGGLVEAAANLNLPLIYTATDYVLTCRRGTYFKRTQNICTIREELTACTTCIGPHTLAEYWLTQAWHLLPGGLAQPFVTLAEQVAGKRADFIHAETSLKHRFTYLSQWRPRIEHVIAPSSHMRDMLVLNGVPAERITISPYGVPLPPAGFSKVPSPKLRFGFIGRIAAIKGVHLLLEAFQQLPQPERAELTLYGQAEVRSDQYYQQLKKQATHLPNIKFAGVADNAQISQIYRHLDVLVVPSIWPENSPITILEALAHGIPVIASDVKGIADLVQDEANGLIFANQNIQDLTRQMTRCLDSPELVAQLEAQCRPVKSLSEEIADLIRLYEEVLSESR
jgi:glycosyltransferase involved in cell wall biosynthesis